MERREEDERGREKEKELITMKERKGRERERARDLKNGINKNRGSATLNLSERAKEGEEKIDFFFAREEGEDFSREGDERRRC